MPPIERASERSRQPGSWRIRHFTGSICWLMASPWHISRSVVMGMTAADDEAAQQALVQTVLSFDTNGYDEVDGIGIPKFDNGDHDFGSVDGREPT